MVPIEDYLLIWCRIFTADMCQVPKESPDLIAF